MSNSNDYESNAEIALFRKYLQIPSVHPNIDYEPCIAFLKEQASSLNLPVQICYPANEQNPLLIMTWLGSQPDLPAILLNSHMDVVPVFADKWTHEPFAADLDKDGRIFARGAQDMKCVGMQYLAAVRALKKKGVQLKRTVHLSYVPDEEYSGRWGMRPFVETKQFKDLNLGFSLDEGIASETANFGVFYAERSVWRLYFKITGKSGHGSLLLKNTAGEKLNYIVSKMMALRAEQVQRLENNPELTIGDVTTINLTQLRGGIQSNVVPHELVVCFDIRLAIDVDHVQFENMLNRFCEEAGGGITIEFESKRPRVEPTKTDDTNPFWLAFKNAMNELNLQMDLAIFPGGTDSRYVRHAGIPALGFSPINNTPVLLHDHDEYLKADTYLRGIEIYEKIITNLANV